MKKSICFIALSFVSMMVLLSLQACSEPPAKEAPPKLVKAMQIADPGRLPQRSFPGRAEAEKEATLAFRVSGHLIARPVDLGDKVTRGTVLARLDPTDFESALNAVRGDLVRAEAALEDATADFRRATEVQAEDSGAISQQAVDRAKAALSMSQAGRDSARAAVKLAQDRLGYAVLKAPFKGEIVATYVEAFENVIAKQKIIRMISQDSIEFKIDVPESLIGYAQQIASVVVRFDIRPDIAIAATIKEVGREASQDTRTYPVTLLLQPDDTFDVLPGMAGKAHIEAKLPEKAVGERIEIPATALFAGEDNDQSFVWIIADKKLVKRQVTVGLPSQHGVFVRSGLSPGEWIVVAGVNSVVDGQSVRVIDATDTKELP